MLRKVQVSLEQELFKLIQNKAKEKGLAISSLIRLTLRENFIKTGEIKNDYSNS